MTFISDGMNTFITGRNEVLAKVMFLQASVILSRGGGVLQFSRGVVCSNFSGGVL